MDRIAYRIRGFALTGAFDFIVLTANLARMTMASIDGIAFSPFHRDAIDEH